MVGTTARLDALQAALLRVKLRRLEGWNEDRRRVGAKLRAGLVGTSLQLPSAASPEGDHVYHLFVARSGRREALRAFLTDRGIATAVHYPIPIHRTGAYANLGLGAGSLPVAERLAEQICTLPLFPLMTDDEIARVTSAVQDFDMEGS
jgi:dTDP-4-amino-4,6-dideoxygalactose transaminase